MRFWQSVHSVLTVYGSLLPPDDTSVRSELQQLICVLLCTGPLPAPRFLLPCQVSFLSVLPVLLPGCKYKRQFLFQAVHCLLRCCSFLLRYPRQAFLHVLCFFFSPFKYGNAQFYIYRIVWVCS